MRCFVVLVLCFVATCLSDDYYRYSQRPGGYSQFGFGRRQRFNRHQYRPSGHHYYHHLPPFMTVGFPHRRPEEVSTPAPEIPAAPAEPLNPILDSLSQLPQSLYNNFICNKLASGSGSPNVEPYLARHKRGLFTRGYFSVLQHIKQIVANAYVELKPFQSNEDGDLIQKLVEAALNVTKRDVNDLNLENVVIEFIEDKLNSDGIVGDAWEIYEAIKQLGSKNVDQIASSTQEAVDKSCSAVTNKFYCKYISKMVQNSGCSGAYFSTEILDKCCSFFDQTEEIPLVPNQPVTQAPSTSAPATEALPTEAPATQAPSTQAPTPASTTQSPSTQAPTTQAPATPAPTTQAPTTQAPTTQSPSTQAPTTQAPATPAPTTQAPTTQAPTTQAPTTQAPTTQAPTTQAPTTQAPTTQATRTCGVSTLNPAAGFEGVARVLNQMRIVGGVNAEKCEYPWMVRLAVGNSLCGGSIIDETHILTAGHCFDGGVTASQVRVHAGEHDFNVQDENEVTIQASAVDIHPQYNTLASGGVEYDAAVITLAEPLQFNECVQPVCLPDPGAGAALPSATQCTVAGWGTTSSGGQASNILKEVTIPTYSGAECNTGIFTATRPSSPSVQLCAGRPVIGGADSCQGDSGGPLFCPVNGRYVQYGIVSYGAGCADAGAAGIYADVSAITSFVSSVTGV